MHDITNCRFVLAIRDLNDTADFYRDKLGFEISELGGPGWLVFSKGECVIMAGECPDDAPAADTGPHSYFAYLRLDDIDSYYDFVTSNGVEIIKPLRDETWGMREFGIRTSDGHRIMFGKIIEG